MEKNITLEKENITYNISIKLVSELIVFHIETSQFPKKIYEKSFSDSDMKSKHKSFLLYDDIQSKFEYLKVSINNPSQIKLIKKDKREEQDAFLELQIPSPIKNLALNDLAPFMIFEIEGKTKRY